MCQDLELRAARHILYLQYYKSIYCKLICNISYFVCMSSINIIIVHTSSAFTNLLIEVIIQQFLSLFRSCAFNDKQIVTPLSFVHRVAVCSRRALSSLIVAILASHFSQSKPQQPISWFLFFIDGLLTARQ